MKFVGAVFQGLAYTIPDDLGVYLRPVAMLVHIGIDGCWANLDHLKTAIPGLTP